MINLYDGGIYEMWPDASSPEAQAYSYALQQAIALVTGYADRSRCYCMIDELPEAAVDYLAVEMRSMYYDQGMDLNRKREIVKGTLRWYTYAGTVSAINEMVDVILGGSGIVEWFDFEEPPYTPGTFDIITEAQMTQELADTVAAIVQKVKNVRSHIRKVVVHRPINAKQYAGAAAQEYGKKSIANIHSETFANSFSLAAGGAMTGYKKTALANTKAEQEAAQAAGYVGSCVGSYSHVYIKMGTAQAGS